MYCKNCGKEIDENAYACPYCGNKAHEEKIVVMQKNQQTNGFAIAGFVLSFIFPFILGIVFSIIGFFNSKKLNGNGKGLSIAGICISVSIILLLLLSAIF